MSRSDPTSAPLDRMLEHDVLRPPKQESVISFLLSMVTPAVFEDAGNARLDKSNSNPSRTTEVAALPLLRFSLLDTQDAGGKDSNSSARDALGSIVFLCLENDGGTLRCWESLLNDGFFSVGKRYFSYRQ